MSKLTNRFTNRLTISNKICLLLITPILALCFFTVQLLQAKYQDLTMQQKAFNAMELSGVYSDLLYSLQKERSFSADRLTIGSLPYDQDKLVKARNVTDKLILKIKESKYKENQLNKSYLANYNAVLNRLINLKEIRYDINLSIKSTYLSYYSKLNLALINSISTLYSIGNDFGTGLLTLAYVDSLWLEEYSHQEHIAIINIFEQEKLDSGLYRDLLNIISYQEGAENNFYNVAPLVFDDILQQVLKSDAHRNILIYREFITYQSSKNNLLISLYEVIGYNGLMHNFKNYLLRGNPEYAIKVRSEAKLAKEFILDFINAHVNTHEKSLRSEKFLNDALKTIELYDNYVEKVTMMKRNNHLITEIDKEVIVDDQPFYKALEWLHFDKVLFDKTLFDKRELNKEFNKKLVRINNLSEKMKLVLQEKIELRIQQIKVSSYQFIGAIITILLFSFFIGYQLRNGLVSEMKYIASFMRRRQKIEEVEYFEIYGKDEISKIKQAFNELRKVRTDHEKNLKLASQVFFSAHEGICITNCNGEIVDINPAFSKITGYSKAEVITNNSERFKYDRQSTYNNEQIWEKLISEGYWKGEVFGKTKSGATLVQNLTISAVKNEQGRVNHYIGMFIDITESKRKLKRLQEMAYHDPLTKLPNRALLDERFKLSLAYSKREKCHLAVCYIDLNKFKPVNDTYGHDIGDLLLFTFAERLSASTREQDTVARVGGDEFVLLLNSTKGCSEFKVALDRILDSINQPFIIKGHHIDLGFSIGISLYPEHGDSLELLLKLADKAMFQAKFSQQHQYTLYDPT